LNIFTSGENTWRLACLEGNNSIIQHRHLSPRASEIIQRAPGSRGTRLHRSIGDPARLLAIASWDSKSARDAMEAHPSEEVRRIIAAQAEFVDINVIGECEDPDWVVEPDRQSDKV
jgi:hypothetical protein